jgi:hypothetical protein
MGYPCRNFGPTLDPSKQALDTRTIPLHPVVRLVRPRRENVAFLGFVLEHEGWNKILGSRQDKDVGFFAVVVFRQTSIGATCGGWDRQVPPEAERPVASARIVGQRQLWTEPGTPR